MMTAGNKLRRVHGWLGYRMLEGKNRSMLPILMGALSLFLLLHTALFVFTRRDKSSMGFVLGIKDCNITLSIFCMSLENIFKNNVIRTTLITDKKPAEYRDANNADKKQMFQSLKSKQELLLDSIGYLIVGIISILILVPFLVAAYIVVFVNGGVQHTEIDQLPLPFVFYFPSGYDAITAYIIVYLLQVTFYIDIMGHIYMSFGCVATSIESLVIDIKILCYDIDNMDRVIGSDDKSLHREFDLVCHETVATTLKKYTVYLIKSHQNICRNMMFVNDRLSFFITIGNQAICFQICVFLYCMAETDNNFAKGAYLMLIATETVLLFTYCYNGQKIINENNILRQSLARTSWLEKPNWFKKMLIIMMSRGNTPLHVKPFGLYVLNLNNFTNLMNIAYTYFNFLRTFKKGL